MQDPKIFGSNGYTTVDDIKRAQMEASSFVTRGEIENWTKMMAQHLASAIAAINTQAQAINEQGLVASYLIVKFGITEEELTEHKNKIQAAIDAQTKVDKEL